MEADHFISRLMLSSYKFSALVVEGVDGFSKKKEAWVKKVGEVTRRHEIEMNDLKKSFEADKLKLKADKEALDVQKKAFVEEKAGLKASVVQATSDNQWLIEQGFQQVVTYLLYSNEFNFALGEVYTKLLNYGKHLGLIAGFKLHESGQALEQSPMFRPDVSGELKPAELNEKVCAKVLDSLSKKCYRSGDSEETFSEDTDVSKEASLESSAVRGDGGPKAKKAKKANKSKDGGSGASKPLVDV
ncbi:hypothetical protein Hanom_Chr01g00053141 [Helianthus anomalus]